MVRCWRYTYIRSAGIIRLRVERAGSRAERSDMRTMDSGAHGSAPHYYHIRTPYIRTHPLKGLVSIRTPKINHIPTSVSVMRFSAHRLAFTRVR